MRTPTTAILRLAAPIAALLITLAATPVRADLIITVLDSTAPAGGTGFFDVTVTNNGATAVDVSAFTLEVTMPSLSGGHFASVDMNTTLTYIFSSSGPPPFSFDTFPNTDFTVSDSPFASPLFREIAAGGSFGLVHVSYSIDAGTPDGTAIPVSIDTNGTSFSDTANPAGLIPFNTTNGTILVATRAVPEPGSLLLFGLGGGLLLWNRRRASASPPPSAG